MQALHDVVGDEIALVFCETLAQSPHKLRARMSTNAIAARLLGFAFSHENIKGTEVNNFAVVN